MTPELLERVYSITEGQLRNLIYARYEKEGGIEVEDDRVHNLIKETLAVVRSSSTTSAGEGMTDYTPLHPVMREDFNEYDWMNVDWWLPRARARAARIIHDELPEEYQ